MLNKIKKHLKTFILDNKILYLYLQYKTVKLILSNIIIFKNYTAKVYKIILYK